MPIVKVNFPELCFSVLSCSSQGQRWATAWQRCCWWRWFRSPRCQPPSWSSCCSLLLCPPPPSAFPPRPVAVCGRCRSANRRALWWARCPGSQRQGSACLTRPGWWCRRACSVERLRPARGVKNNEMLKIMVYLNFCNNCNRDRATYPFFLDLKMWVCTEIFDPYFCFNYSAWAPY